MVLSSVGGLRQEMIWYLIPDDVQFCEEELACLFYASVSGRSNQHCYSGNYSLIGPILQLVSVPFQFYESDSVGVDPKIEFEEQVLYKHLILPYCYIFPNFF